VERREALDKLTGRELYVDDLPADRLPGGELLWGATVRSPAPRGRIRGIRFGDGVDWSGFVVVDHRDVPGRNHVYLSSEDQPALAEGYVRHVHEPVLLLAHPDRRELRRGVWEVEIEVDPDPPIFDALATPDPEQIQRGDDNVLKRIEIRKGDVEAALAEAPVVVEGEYRTGAQEHVYLENQGMVAWTEGGPLEAGGTLVVQGSMQCPFYVVNALRPVFDLPEERIRVVQTPTGGGFGGKEEYPSMIAVHAALLAVEAGRPVKLIYERGEDMAATTKRHPSVVRHRTGVDEEGRLLAQDIEVVLDGGAYLTLSHVVLSRALIHATGPYACDHVRTRGRAMFTNAVPFGAFRGFGNPQVFFACERHMDRIARRLGLDPAEVRRINLIREGETTQTGQVIGDGADREAVLDRALEMSRWSRRRAANAAFNARHSLRKRGIGLATFYHGAGFTGSGEVELDSRLEVAGTPAGGVEIRSSIIEMGQGALTTLIQVAAERLGIDPDRIRTAEPDTSEVPDTGPTVASRTTMVVGRLVERACDDLRARLGLGPEDRGEAVVEAIRGWHRERPEDDPGGALLGRARYSPPAGIEWDGEGYRGDAYAAYAWAAYVAEVEVDLRTCLVRLRDFCAVQEVGKLLNETLARGQIQGGVAQGLSWALYEDVTWREGAMENTQLTNYIIPTSDDLPPIRVGFLESRGGRGVRGAKGIGELPMDGSAPAAVNAVAAAVDVDPREIPLTPERLLELVEESRAEPREGERRGEERGGDRVGERREAS